MDLGLPGRAQSSPAGAQQKALGDFPFTSGKVGIGLASGWELKEMRQLKFNWKTIPAPVRKKGDTSHAWGDSVPYYLWTGSKQKDASWQLMSHVSSVESGNIVYKNNGWTPPCPESWVDAGLDKDPLFKGFWAESQKPTKAPNYLRTEFHWSCIQQDTDAIWTRYTQKNVRPLDPMVKESAAKAQKCLDDRYAKS